MYNLIMKEDSERLEEGLQREAESPQAKRPRLTLANDDTDSNSNISPYMEVRENTIGRLQELCMIKKLPLPTYKNEGRGTSFTITCVVGSH